MRAHLVEEVAVVAHHKHRVLKVAEIVFQPFHGFEVEVVGRFVEQQVVRFAKECLRQHHAHLFLTREVAHEFSVQGFLDAKAAKQRGGIVFGGVAAHLCKLVFQFGHEDAVLIGEVGLRIKFVAALHHVPHHRVPHEHRVEHGKLVVLKVVLAQHRQAFAGAHLYRAFRGVELAGDGAEQRGLACAVRADNAVDVAVGELHIHILIKDALAKLNGQI